MTLLLPCLLFTEIMKCLDPSKIEQFVIIFIFCTCNCYLVHVFIGMGVGWILSKLLGASHDSGRLIMACIGFQGTTAIPIVFASVLGDSQLTKSDKNFGVDAITYVLIFTVFVTIYKWTIAYK